MLHRIRLDLAFPTEAPMNDIREEVMRRFPNAVTINAGKPYQEEGFVIIEKCYHDEDPDRDCQIQEYHTTGVT